ncbi:MAG TPA: hypothetical protein VF169_01095 [Albitalea sp.]|uniref:hypothetical protein n=1 Tax=Piscinibacter sp. TaxID=1903157 RepID=UPI002ED42A40
MSTIRVNPFSVVGQRLSVQSSARRFGAGAAKARGHEQLVSRAAGASADGGVRRAPLPTLATPPQATAPHAPGAQAVHQAGAASAAPGEPRVAEPVAHAALDTPATTASTQPPHAPGLEEGIDLWRGRTPPMPQPNSVFGHSRDGAPSRGSRPPLPPTRGFAAPARPRGARALRAVAHDVSATQAPLSGLHDGEALRIQLMGDDVQAYLREEPDKHYHGVRAYLYRRQAANEPAKVGVEVAGRPSELGRLDIARIEMDWGAAQRQFKQLAGMR